MSLLQQRGRLGDPCTFRLIYKNAITLVRDDSLAQSANSTLDELLRCGAYDCASSAHPRSSVWLGNPSPMTSSRPWLLWDALYLSQVGVRSFRNTQRDAVNGCP